MSWSGQPADGVGIGCCRRGIHNGRANVLTPLAFRAAHTFAVSIGDIDDAKSRIREELTKVFAFVMLPTDDESKVFRMCGFGDAVAQRGKKVSVAIRSDLDEDGGF
jgi:hypothetical protein